MTIQTPGKAASGILFGPFCLDVVNQCLWRGVRPITLTPKVFAMLSYLVEHSGQLVTKEKLLDAVWAGSCVSDAVLKVCVRRLREALGERSTTPRFIETVHRRGYRFIGKITGDNQQNDHTWSPVHPSPQPPPTPEQRGAGHQGNGNRAALAASRGASAVPVVGREAELTYLRDCLARALDGARQVVFITGETGIGKTTLVETFLAGSALPAGVWVARGQCIEHYGAGEAYLPILAALDSLCRAPGHRRLLSLLERYAPTWLLQMPAHLSPADRSRLRHELQGATPERMLREMAELSEALTAETPLVLVLEDLHWSDYATLNLLSFMARRREPHRLLLLGTYRPMEVGARGHPLGGLKHELQLHGQCQELPLAFLTEEAVEHYLTRRFPNLALPHALARLVHQRTDGNPFFMTTVVDHLATQGVIRQCEGRWSLHGDVAALQIGAPASIEQMVEAQISQLTTEEQGVLKAASIAGLEFSAAAAAAGLEAESDAVEEVCDGLARRNQFLRARGASEWPDGTVAARYEFIHSLYQSVWYKRVTAGKAAHVHRRIGERLEHAYGERAREVAAELAVHFERGRDVRKALQYYRAAARNALQRCGYREAIQQLTRGIALLHAQPDTPERRRQEITLQIPLGVALVATKGYAAPEVEAAYTRARALCRQEDATPQLGWALWGLQVFYFVRGQLHTAGELGEQLLHLARQRQDPKLLSVAHYTFAPTLFAQGELPRARTHLEQAIALCDAHKYSRLQAMCLSFSARVLWLSGYLEQALRLNQQALALASALAHPFTTVVVTGVAALLHVAQREPRAVQARTETVIALSTDQGFTDWLAQGTVLRGWALAAQGRWDEGIEQMHHGLTVYQSTGAELGRPLFLGLLADIYGNAGRPADALTNVTEALAAARGNGQRLWEAWLHWLNGELLFNTEDDRRKAAPSSRSSRAARRAAAAEECFRQALALTRRSQAKWLELRTVISLSRLLRRQHKPAEARQLLAETYAWFTEGFQRPELQEARVLLDELR